MMEALVVTMLLLGACGSTQSGASGGSERCWPVEPFRLEALEHGREWEPVMTVSADGTVRRPGSDVIRGRFTRRGPHDVFTAGDGSRPAHAVLTCGPDRVIELQGKRARYGADDTLDDGGVRIEIRDDGEVRMGTGPNHPDQRARIVGDVRRVRRTAVLLVLASMGL